MNLIVYLLMLLFLALLCGFLISVKEKQLSLAYIDIRELKNKLVTAKYESDHYQRMYRLVSTAANQAAYKKAATPPVTTNLVSWRVIFGFSKDQKVTLDQLNTKFKKLSLVHHPDVGGTNYGMTLLNAAKEKALKEVK